MFVAIDDMTVLSSGELSVQGAATTILGQRVSLEVRTGLGSHQQLLNFPGLRVRWSGLGFVALPEINVDLGPRARIFDLNVNRHTRTLHLGAKVTITPDHTMMRYDQSASSIPTNPMSSTSAQCSVDVGKWLTRLGRFSL
jgi:hypothetical protein